MNKNMIISLIVLMATSQAFAQSTPKDSANSKDHPLISRFPNTHIVSYHSSEFEEFMLATGPINQDIRTSQGKAALPPVKHYEGRTTSINYKANRNEISSLAIFRNFEKAFNNNGFEKIYSCKSDKECGKRFISQLYWYGDASRQGRHRYLDAPNLHGTRHQYFYWSGRAKTEGKNYLISLLVAQHSAANFPAKIILDINETEKLNDNKITIDLKDIQNGIAESGKAVLNGVLFDHDKATLKAESAAAVNVIANYLIKHPQQKFYVVGHTDSKGSLAHNRRLSEGRAATVVQTLIATHNINQKQLTAYGVGPVSPTTSNKTESGRAKNRRVEMVLQD